MILGAATAELRRRSQFLSLVLFIPADSLARPYACPTGGSSVHRRADDGSLTLVCREVRFATDADDGLEAAEGKPKVPCLFREEEGCAKSRARSLSKRMPHRLAFEPKGASQCAAAMILGALKEKYHNYLARRLARQFAGPSCTGIPDTVSRALPPTSVEPARCSPIRE